MTGDMSGTGDYRAVAQKVTSIADVLVARAGNASGMAVLDVACGTGNASILVARLGYEYRLGPFVGPDRARATTRCRALVSIQLPPTGRRACRDQWVRSPQSVRY